MLQLKNFNFSSCSHQLVTAVTQRSNNVLCFIARWFLACWGSQPISGHYPWHKSFITHMAEKQSSTASNDICLTYVVVDLFRNKESNLTALLKPNTCRLSVPATEESAQTTFNASNKPASLQSLCCMQLHRRSASLKIITEVWQFCFYSYSFAKLILHLKPSTNPRCIN